MTSKSLNRGKLSRGLGLSEGVGSSLGSLLLVQLDVDVVLISDEPRLCVSLRSLCCAYEKKFRHKLPIADTF